MDVNLFTVLESRRTPRCLLYSDHDAGLRAVLVLDDMTLGPAAGGIRTRAYDSLEAAVDDAAALARAMTLKCALGGLDAGGGKMVVLDHPGLTGATREAAFARLGERVDELGGMFRTSGDLGTTAADLDVMARHCRYIHTRVGDLSRSVARGVVACMHACASIAGKPGLAGLRVAVQGCGDVGGAVARDLARAGAELLLADIDERRAGALAAELDARVVAAGDILTCDADIVSPCAVGGVITAEVAGAMRAWALCGAANLMMAGARASQRIHARGISHVPDVVSSAGAVVDGVGDTVMGLADRSALIDALGQTALELLMASKQSGQPTDELAEDRAWARIRASCPPTRKR